MPNLGTFFDSKLNNASYSLGKTNHVCKNLDAITHNANFDDFAVEYWNFGIRSI